MAEEVKTNMEAAGASETGAKGEATKAAGDEVAAGATVGADGGKAAGGDKAPTTAELQDKLNEMLAGLVTKTAQQAAPQKEEKAATEKTYTQAELDAALAAAKEKPGKDAPENTDLVAQLKELKAQIATSKMRDNALAALSAAGVPADLADTLPYHDSEANAAAVKKLCENWKQNVDAGVMQRLGGKTPEGLGSGKSADTAVAAQIAKNIRGL